MYSRFNSLLYMAVLFTIFLPFASPALPQSSDVRKSKQQIAAEVQKYVQAAVKFNNFSGTILVARGKRTLVNRGYGMANLELAHPNKPQTVFRIGSMTKPFTAMAIMILQERGKLSAGDSVCRYFADCPAAWQTITLRNLLTHTSGIPNFTSMPNFVETMRLPATHAEIISRFKNLPLEFAPGERFSYSNSNYFLLGTIIEKVSGEPYEDFLRENIFAPLGMTHTGYDSDRTIIKNRASGYEIKDDSIFNAPFIDMSVVFAAGALYSTTADLLLWQQALTDERLVTRKSLDEIFTPFKEDYGYGWWIEKRFNRKMIDHGGNISGFASSLAWFPSERVTVIVLSNSQNAPAEKISGDLAAIIFGAPYKIPQKNVSPVRKE